LEEDYITLFFKSKTYIVYSPSLFSSYNFEIKDIIDSNWTITEYELIHYADFEKIKNNDKNSFLLLTEVQFTHDKTATSYNFLNLVMGTKRGRISEMPDLVNIPLSLSDQDDEKWVHKLTTLILFIQNHMVFLKENPEKRALDITQIYYDNKLSLEGKTLYLLKEELAPDVDSAIEISKIYQGKVKFVDKAELKKAIESKIPDIVFLHLVGPESPRGNRTCFKILIGTADASIFYYSSHIVTKNKTSLFLAEDFKNISN